MTVHVADGVYYLPETLVFSLRGFGVRQNIQWCITPTTKAARFSVAGRT